MKILIVDDEEDIGLMLCKILNGLGHEVIHASRITKARELMDDSDYELYFLDLNLPDGSGFDLIKNIKNIHPTPRIIIISAYDGAIEMNRARRHGVYKIIHKPFSKQQILELMQEIS